LEVNLSQEISKPIKDAESTLDLLGVIFGISLAILSVYLIIDKHFFVDFVHGTHDVLLFGVLTFIALIASIILIIKSLPPVQNKGSGDYGEQMPF
jgi:uncharacterized BrkB/YihY/UPF0761 family membrane protein